MTYSLLNSTNNSISGTEFSSLDGSGNGENTGAGFVEISKIFAALDTFLIGTDPFETVYLSMNNNTL